MLIQAYPQVIQVRQSTPEDEDRMLLRKASKHLPRQIATATTANSFLASRRS